MHLKLITPERVLVDQEIASVSVPTADGEITMLPGHAPLAATVVAGIARYRGTDGKEEEMAVSEGVVHVGADGVISVMAETAERGHELELSVIEQAKARAEAAMKEMVAKDDVAFAAAAAALERELARYRLVSKHRTTHRTTPESAE